MPLRVFLALAALAASASCTPESPPLEVLRVSAIPDQAAANVKAQHVPVLDIVCESARVRCEWVPIDTYDGVVEALGSGRIDMAFLGGVTHARAHQKHGAIAVAIRDVDTRFSSTLVVPAGSPARRLNDLHGATFLFGNRASTSGHVMARYFLVREGVKAESFFSRVGYADNHDETLERVASGDAQAGIVNSGIALRALGQDGRYQGRLRVLWESPAYVDYVWTVRREIPGALRTRIADAFLDVNRERQRDEAALRAEGAGGFLPATEAEYALVAAASREAEGR